MKVGANLSQPQAGLSRNHRKSSTTQNSAIEASARVSARHDQRQKKAKGKTIATKLKM